MARKKQGQRWRLGTWSMAAHAKARSERGVYIAKTKIPELQQIVDDHDACVREYGSYADFVKLNS